MTLRSFDYKKADTVEEAAELLKKHGENARVVAGGTDLLGALKENIHPEYPELLVDIKAIPDLDGIEETDNGLKIGALTRLSSLSEHPVVKEKYGLLAEAARTVASPQLRNMGTVGGNICQEARCWYYRYPENQFHCFRKGGDTCPALTGENRYHSIFGAADLGPGCSSECPGHIDIPDYMAKIREQKIDEAARILLSRNPMPAITGRTCPHFCENGCNRKDVDASVSVRAVERTLGDYALEHASIFYAPPEKETGKTVAVIGSGPAGMSAAYYLRKAGYRVTVFEKMEKAGGMLQYGIPPYRLSKKIVGRLVKALESMGTEFRFNTSLGKEVDLDSLKESYDNIFIAIGDWDQRKLGIPGEEMLISGLDFLVGVNKGSRVKPGEKVLVIGGGNVAIDAARTALRLGADSVEICYRRSRKEMPANEEEIREAIEEGITIRYLLSPVETLGKNGVLSGVKMVAMELGEPDESGRRRPVPVEGSEFIVDADTAMLAIGQAADLSCLNDGFEVSRGRAVADQESQKTNVSGVFAGGDLTTGPATIIEAVASGRRAANSIVFSADNKEDPELTNRLQEKPFLAINTDGIKQTKRVSMPAIPLNEHNLDREDYLGLAWNAAKQEAGRCLNCGCVAVNASDLAPALIALSAQIKTDRRIIDAEDFFDARTGKTTILNDDELVLGIEIPEPKPGTLQKYWKYRLRNSIDFPICSVASVLTMDGNRIKDTRIVLGAVAPTPIRLQKFEGFIKEKSIGSELAEEINDFSFNRIIPLEKNGYKIQMTRALLRKVIWFFAEKRSDDSV